ncbi:MAG: crossover junction endodeoxyribonuclease RuvC [Oscillospiraceae bacterium]|nr:crossover junction endodeoxyribonuclease RuvC [Oscillospiraceae bacterium]
MKILGIDPGFAIVGFGVVDYANNKFNTIEYGQITSPAKTPMNKRIKMVYDDVTYLMKKHRPQVMAIESLFFNSNQKTAINVAMARGALMLAAENQGLDIAEYTPLQVKQAVVGYGRADKKQVQIMVKTILGLDEIPKPDDAADALAIAIAHAHTNQGLGFRG